jgi:DNA-binding LytR/AlgR family response regulator
METLYLTRHKQIGINEILYLESMSNYTLIHTTNKRKTMAAQTLHLIHSSINYKSFLRINRSFILNTEYISTYSLKNNKLIFQLSNGQQFTASRRRIKNCLNEIEILQKSYIDDKETV